MAFCNIALLSGIDPFKQYEEIAKSKTKKYKETLYGTSSAKSDCYNLVKERYDVYNTNERNLEYIFSYENFSSTEKDALLHCYNGNTKLVKELKELIINNQNIYYRSKCAYCGIGDTNNLDHYLPKDKFPEYSIHCNNLIPCCSYCNEKKSDLFLDSNGFRKIFNPYFEHVEDKFILECRLECLTSSVKLQIVKKNCIINQVWLNHIVYLNLINRYENELPRVFASIIFDIIANYKETGFDPEGAHRVMKRKLNETERIQGVNSLDAIIFRAFLEVPQLFDMDYLEKIYFSMSRTAA